jgi:hypothetical protein
MGHNLNGSCVGRSHPNPKPIHLIKTIPFQFLSIKNEIRLKMKVFHHFFQSLFFKLKYNSASYNKVLNSNALSMNILIINYL